MIENCPTLLSARDVRRQLDSVPERLVVSRRVFGYLIVRTARSPTAALLQLVLLNFVLVGVLHDLQGMLIHALLIGYPVGIIIHRTKF